MVANEPKKPKAPAAQSNGNGALDSSENAFPSLGPSPGAGKAPSTSKPSSWAAGSGAIKKPIKVAQPVFSSNFTLDKVEPSRGHDGKPVTLGAVIKDVMNKTNARIEASTQRTTGGTTFHVKGDSENIVEAAIRSITAALSPQVRVSLNRQNYSLSHHLFYSIRSLSPSTHLSLLLAQSSDPKVF